MLLLIQVLKPKPVIVPVPLFLHPKLAKLIPPGLVAAGAGEVVKAVAKAIVENSGDEEEDTPDTTSSSNTVVAPSKTTTQPAPVPSAPAEEVFAPRPNPSAPVSLLHRPCQEACAVCVM